MLIGCSTHSVYRPHGQFLQEFYSFYINDSLQIFYRFPGDYNEVKSNKETKNKLRQLNLTKWDKYVLGHFETKDSPSLEHIVFYFPDSKKLKLSAELYFKDSITIDTNLFIVSKSLSIKDKGSLLILAHSDKNHFNNLKGEYLDGVFPTVKAGSNYKADLDFKDPFSLVDKLSIGEDSIVNYALPIHKLIESAPNYKATSDEYTYIQALATYYALMSNTEQPLHELIKQWRGKNYMSQRDDSDLKVLYHDFEAIDIIVEKCKNEKIVMINELHFTPYHRYFVHLLLDRLYKEGFRYFGLEALWEDAHEINARKFCLTKSGFYTRSPSMSNLISHAICQGYTIFGYDDFSNDRERNQAINIHNATFSQDPDAKVLILAGFGHISERQSKGRSMMAGEFLNNFDIDPFTIDQIEFDIEMGKHFIGIVDDSTIISKKKIPVDLYLVNQLTFDRFSSAMNYTKQKLSIDFERLKYPAIISIYDSNNLIENPTAIPLYNYFLEDKPKKPIEVYLPKKDFTYTIKNKFNAILQSGRLGEN